jgi:hypothetical protein
VDGRKSLEGEVLGGLSVGAKCVSEGRNWVLSWGWDRMMGWDDGTDEGGGFEMGREWEWYG